MGDARLIVWQSQSVKLVDPGFSPDRAKTQFAEIPQLRSRIHAGFGAAILGANKRAVSQKRVHAILKELRVRRGEKRPAVLQWLIPFRRKQRRAAKLHLALPLRSQAVE